MSIGEFAAFFRTRTCAHDHFMDEATGGKRVSILILSEYNKLCCKKPRAYISFYASEVFDATKEFCAAVAVKCTRTYNFVAIWVCILLLMAKTQ